MKQFGYAAANDAPQAVRLRGEHQQAKFLGGGTNLVDLMRERIEHPDFLIDVTGLPRQIEHLKEGGLSIGAAVKNTELAAHPLVREQFPMLSRAILAGASGQIRNMATVGGNILQRTRCLYFYDDTARCNKRSPESGCDAVGGFNRMHAILGASPACIATHPSDMCVALSALDAVVCVAGPRGNRAINLADFHRLPGDRPDIETELAQDELITTVQLPPSSFARRSTYRKVRDRASYAFALVSVAAALDLDKDGAITDVRLALGGVAHKPWRARVAEKLLHGTRPSDDSFRAAAQAELAAAHAFKDNTFKIELATRLIISTLKDISRGAQS